MTQFQLPHGDKIALSGAGLALGFSDIDRLKTAVQRAMSEHLNTPPKRILGCLEDSVKSLMALLACPELCDYMPVNPRLREDEIIALAQNGGADAAILSEPHMAGLGKRLTQLGLHVLCWDEVFAAAQTAMGGADPVPGPQWGDGEEAGRLILHTSGTTGTPKRVPITLPAMMQSAKNIARFHDLREDDVALNTLPTFHIGAVVDVLLAPFHAGGSVALTADRSAQGLASAIRLYRPTWVQLVPTLLMHIIEDLDEAELKDLGASLRFVRNISAPVPPALRDRAEALLGCPIIEMYGMTETAGQITTNGRAPQDRRAGSVGRPKAVKVKILDETGSEVAQGRPGEICVSGPTVFDGYEGVPRAQVFFDDWFRTGDLGALDSDGFLSIQGRLKEMINIGGEKLAPSEVELVALSHPDVKEAAAYAVPHPTLGEVSGLTIAVRSAVDPDDFKQFLAKSLADFKVPRRLHQVAELPRLPNAKVDRLKIARDARADAQTDRASDAPTRQSPVGQKVAALWAKHLESRPPEGADDFFDMGGDSLSATSFLVDLSEALGRPVPPNQLFETPSYDKLVAAVSVADSAPAHIRARAVRYVAERMSGWPGQVSLKHGLFRGIGTIQNGAPLFWSCQTVQEVDLARTSFAARRPLYVVTSLFQFGGRSVFRRNKRSEADFDTLATELVHEIQQIQPDGPVSLGGFCGGAQVMQRVARHLREAGREIKIFVSLDYWPTAPMDCPVIHGMSRCTQHSARNFLRDMGASLPVLHPKGLEVLEVDAPHIWTADQFPTEAKRIQQLLDADDVQLPLPDAQPGWGFAERSAPPQVRLKPVRLPRLFAPGSVYPFEIEVQNTSEYTLPAYEHSGLAVELRLVNLDGCVRDAYAGFGKLSHDLAPQERTIIQGEVRFPKKAVPLVLVAQFQSHGITPASRPSRRGAVSVVWPRRLRVPA